MVNVPKDKLDKFRCALTLYWDSPLFDGFDGDGPFVMSDAKRLRPAQQRQVVEVVRGLVVAARGLLPSLGEDPHGQRVLVKLARQLERGAERVERDFEPCVVPDDCYASTDDAEVLMDVIESRKPRAMKTLGNGGPAKAFRAVCKAIIAKGRARALQAGDRVELDEVHRHEAGERRLAANYLSPGGVLAKGGWIERDGDHVLLTGLGADEAAKQSARHQQLKRRRD